MAAQAAVTLSKNAGGWYALTYIVSAIFFVEINLRFYTSRVLANAYLPFFKEISNLAGLCFQNASCGESVNFTVRLKN